MRRPPPRSTRNDTLVPHPTPLRSSVTTLRAGRRLGPPLLIEEAEVAVAELDPGMLTAMRSRWVIGDPSGAADEVARLAATYAVDEVMIHPVAGAYAGTAPQESPNRDATLELLADSLG